jgi:hypothetical protein
VMLEVGAELDSIWGERLRVLRFEPDGRIYLREVGGSVGAAILIYPGQVGRHYHLVERAAPPETLGARRPGGSYHSVPDVETWYWRPCLTPAHGEATPHCWFIASSRIISLYCPTCRPTRIVVGETFVVRAPATPWHPGRPVWEGARNAADLREWYEERAAIIQYDGKVTRAAAEDQAYRQLLLRIENARRPVGEQMELVA